MAIYAQLGDSLRYPVTNHKTLLNIIHLFNNAVHRIYREHNQNFDLSEMRRKRTKGTSNMQAVVY